MSAFHLERSAVTPLVVLDTQANRLAFEGDCYPENPTLFFSPLLEALEAHLGARRRDGFVADFHLRYVNSASTVTLHRIFALLDRAAVGGSGVRIVWSHDADDDVNEELGGDLARDCRHVEVVRRPIAGA